MNRKNMFAFVLTFVAVMTILVVSPVVSQEKPADNMQILLDKAKADKKFVIAENMELTESEARGFWPVNADHWTVAVPVEEAFSSRDPLTLWPETRSCAASYLKR